MNVPRFLGALHGGCPEQRRPSSGARRLGLVFKRPVRGGGQGTGAVGAPAVTRRARTGAQPWLRLRRAAAPRGDRGGVAYSARRVRRRRNEEQLWEPRPQRISGDVRGRGPATGGVRIPSEGCPGTPGSADAEQLMTQLDADPAFVRLCRAQESFRARLTPKPWRCGCERPAVCFPREHAHDEERFSEWLQRYDKACDAKATCRVVEEVGWRRVHPDVAPILSAHDRVTKATSTLPLA